MGARAAALFFDSSEVGALVPVGFGIIIVGDGVEARRIGGSPGDDIVGHGYNRRGVYAAAEFSEDGAVRAQPAADGLAEDAAEVFFEFGVGSVADFLVRIKIPIPANGMLSFPNAHER